MPPGLDIHDSITKENVTRHSLPIINNNKINTSTINTSSSLHPIDPSVQAIQPSAHSYLHFSSLIIAQQPTYRSGPALVYLSSCGTTLGHHGIAISFFIY
jgi:hypothetical protein